MHIPSQVHDTQPVTPGHWSHQVTGYWLSNTIEEQAMINDMLCNLLQIKYTETHGMWDKQGHH